MGKVVDSNVVEKIKCGSFSLGEVTLENGEKFVVLYNNDNGKELSRVAYTPSYFDCYTVVDNRFLVYVGDPSKYSGSSLIDGLEHSCIIFDTQKCKSLSDYYLCVFNVNDNYEKPLYFINYNDYQFLYAPTLKTFKPIKLTSTTSERNTYYQDSIAGFPRVRYASEYTDNYADRIVIPQINLVNIDYLNYCIEHNFQVDYRRLYGDTYSSIKRVGNYYKTWHYDDGRTVPGYTVGYNGIPVFKNPCYALDKKVSKELASLIHTEVCDYNKKDKTFKIFDHVSFENDGTGLTKPLSLICDETFVDVEYYASNNSFANNYRVAKSTDGKVSLIKLGDNGPKVVDKFDGCLLCRNDNGHSYFAVAKDGVLQVRDENLNIVCEDCESVLFSDHRAFAVSSDKIRILDGLGNIIEEKDRNTGSILVDGVKSFVTVQEEKELTNDRVKSKVFVKDNKIVSCKVGE